jgi:hypothetical protein
LISCGSGPTPNDNTNVIKKDDNNIKTTTPKDIKKPANIEKPKTTPKSEQPVGPSVPKGGKNITAPPAIKPLGEGDKTSAPTSSKPPVKSITTPKTPKKTGISEDDFGTKPVPSKKTETTPVKKPVVPKNPVATKKPTNKTKVTPKKPKKDDLDDDDDDDDGDDDDDDDF